MLVLSFCAILLKSATIFQERDIFFFIFCPHQLCLERNNFYLSRNKLFPYNSQIGFFLCVCRLPCLAVRMNVSVSACFLFLYGMWTMEIDLRSSRVHRIQNHAIIALWSYIKISCTLFCVYRIKTEENIEMHVCVCVCKASKVVFSLSPLEK